MRQMNDCKRKTEHYKGKEEKRSDPALCELRDFYAKV